MSAILDAIYRRAGARRARIVLPEWQDERVLLAAARAGAGELVRPLLMGPAAAIRRRLADLELIDTGLEIADPSPGQLEAMAADLRRLRPGITDENLRRAREEPLHRSVAWVVTGRAEGAVMGARATTADTLRAALRMAGPAAGIETVSSCFLMLLADGRGLVYSDGGVVPAPSASQLADIAEAAAASARTLLGREPRVALLSFSTLGSADHPRVAVVRDAIEYLRQRSVSFVFDGELQADAALVPAVADRKAPASPVAGRADTLIFPDLGAANIAYKLTERLAGARAIGPLLQGVAVPVHDLSRGCSVDDIVDVLAVTSAEVGERESR